MLNRIKNIIGKTDRFFYKQFGSDKSTKILENIKEAQVIFSHINEIGEEDKVRFVGGCVRRAISGQSLDDIDLATSLEPEEVKKRLHKKNINVIDTGISHGTVTAIFNNKKFEITTLRKDILTDGRHAKVEYTVDWEKDALRRDFTINAIYSDIEGRIFDPLKGIPDLQSGKVKFIGLVDERIKEDYLRILRYFRFFLQYSKEDHDLNIIKSIRKHINGLNKISNERIFDEVRKILKLENVYELFSNNASREIILNIFPQFKHYERLKIFNNLDKNIKKRYDNYLILAILILDDSSDYEYFCYKFKTSNALKSRFYNLSANLKNLKNKKFFSKENIKKLIYLSNRNYVIDLLLFSLCLNIKIEKTDILELINYSETCDIPKFPISGEYLKERGYETGVHLGKKLQSLEEEWIKNNFIIEKVKIEKSLNKKK